ncbi:hypothetical protein PHYC_00010 [Phycisphaerales bacterium]|nr:hypothetical protein PHYC_00010 [Phycisphaerales bacterium]
MIIPLCALISAASAWAQVAFDPPAAEGALNAPQITEASGLAASRRNPGVLWTHNDSGDSARVFAIDSQARLLATVNLAGILALDFEDISVGPGPVPGLHYLFVGDIGDNLLFRSTIRVHRFPEPAVSLAQAGNPTSFSAEGVATITLAYPDGPRDAEGLAIDPLSGDLYVFSKQPANSRVYRAAKSQIDPGGQVALSFVAQVPFNLATAADISPDGALIVLRGLDSARAWERGPSQSITEALASQGFSVPVTGRPAEPQGEALGFAQDNSGYFTLTEGSGAVLRFAARRACDPDVNCDGAVNGFDVGAMEQAVNGDQSNFCVPDPDFNRDGSLNGFDVEAVEQSVNGAPCP